MTISPQRLIRSTYIARASRGHLCDSTAFLFSKLLVATVQWIIILTGNSILSVGLHYQIGGRGLVTLVLSHQHIHNGFTSHFFYRPTTLLSRLKHLHTVCNFQVSIHPGWAAHPRTRSRVLCLEDDSVGYTSADLDFLFTKQKNRRIIDVFYHNSTRRSEYPIRTRSQAVARIADRTAKNCKGHVT